MLLVTLGTSLLGNMIAGKGVNRPREGIIRASYGFKKSSIKQFLIPPHPLTNFEIQKYYQNEPRFNGVYSRDNLPNKMKDRAYIINLDEYSVTRTHWIALYTLNNNVIYFNSFGVEQIPKEIKHFIDNKNIFKNIYRIQAYDSVMCGYFCIRFIDFMLTGKNVIEFTFLFSPNIFLKK